MDSVAWISMGQTRLSSYAYFLDGVAGVQREHQDEVAAFHPSESLRNVLSSRKNETSRVNCP